MNRDEQDKEDVKEIKERLEKLEKIRQEARMAIEFLDAEFFDNKDCDEAGRAYSYRSDLRSLLKSIDHETIRLGEMLESRLVRTRKRCLMEAKDKIRELDERFFEATEMYYPKRERGVSHR